MGSQSVTCHPTQVNTPALTPARQPVIFCNLQLKVTLVTECKVT